MRVIAIRNSDEDNVYIYGYGEYVGEEPCPKLFNLKNPKITFDKLRKSLYNMRA